MSIQSKRLWNKNISLCLGNFSRSFSANTMKKTVLNGCVYECSIDYRSLILVMLLISIIISWKSLI